MSLCLPVGLRAGRRVPKPTNHKLPQSSGVNGLFSQCQDKRGEEGIRECVFESGWETRTKRWYWQRGIGTQTSKGRGWMDGGGSRLLGVETEAERGWINKLRYRLPFAVYSSHLRGGILNKILTTTYMTPPLTPVAGRSQPSDYCVNYFLFISFSNCRVNKFIHSQTNSRLRPSCTAVCLFF